MRGERLILWFLLATFGSSQFWAQGMKPLTLEHMLSRDNPEARAQRPPEKPFPPHRVIGNIYYVGEDTHASFLVTTPAGHILINSNYERNVGWIRQSVEKLGFRFSDIKILLSSHAHADHSEGDTLLKEMTGATVMAMDRDVPGLEKMRPGGKPHPIDRVLHDQDHVTLGGTTLVARLTPGHTEGCTTWTTKAQEAGRSYDVVIHCGIGAIGQIILVNNKDYPRIAEDFKSTYALLRSIHADVFMGSDAEHYNMAEKYAAIGKGPNPFIDPEGYLISINNYEQVFEYKLEQQKKAARNR
jgi:metallo-beta-lactamase class B